MLLELKRKWFTQKTTSGVLTIDGEWFCYTLEDVARAKGIKIPGKTCIEAGEYKLVLDYSNRFNRVMPHILNVEMFEGIRIHPGNFETDTDGCILVGVHRSEDAVWRSKDAFDALFMRLKEVSDKGDEISIRITNEPV